MLLPLLFLAATAPQPTSGLPGDVVLPGASPTPAAPEHLKSISLVVIDPGHGGEDGGVKSAAGPVEKDLAFQVATRLKAKLDPETRVLLTRPGDTAMPATERASFANQAKAGLFLSLHAGSSLAPAARGFAVYYHDPAGASADLVAAGSGSLRAVPWSAAQRGVEGESARLASLVHDALAEKLSLPDRGVRRLPLATLEGVTCPAVEVELGQLTNADDALALSAENLQEDIAQALATAVERMDSGAGSGSTTGGGP